MLGTPNKQCTKATVPSLGMLMPQHQIRHTRPRILGTPNKLGDPWHHFHITGGTYSGEMVVAWILPNCVSKGNKGNDGKCGLLTCSMWPNLK